MSVMAQWEFLFNTSFIKQNQNMKLFTLTMFQPQQHVAK